MVYLKNDLKTFKVVSRLIRRDVPYLNRLKDIPIIQIRCLISLIPSLRLPLQVRSLLL